MTIYYSERHGETFTRTGPTYGYTDQYDVERETKKELDAWLQSSGFKIIGFEKV